VKKKHSRRRDCSLSLIGTTGFTDEEVRELAYKTGFQKRTHRKIDVVDLIKILYDQSLKGACSYNDLAERIDEVSGGLVSRQAVRKRMNESCVSLIQQILAMVLSQRVAGQNDRALSHSGRYHRVLVQDSTIIKLPTQLFEEFSGVSNGHSTVCNARIQLTYDLLNGTFTSFSLDPYSKNDQSAAPELELRPGDLTLRDRGYLAGDEFRRHRESGADCIFRHKSNFTYIDAKSGDPIDLLRKLERKNR